MVFTQEFNRYWANMSLIELAYYERIDQREKIWLGLTRLNGLVFWFDSDGLLL